MINTRSKPVCKHHFNRTQTQIASYRRFIRRIANKLYQKYQNKDNKESKIQFTENEYYYFQRDLVSKRPINPPQSPTKGILKQFN
ncbi:hypothetical protein pb186bvf_008069 [Paramecium bursaria]